MRLSQQCYLLFQGMGPAFVGIINTGPAVVETIFIYRVSGKSCLLTPRLTVIIRWGNGVNPFWLALIHLVQRNRWYFTSAYWPENSLLVTHGYVEEKENLEAIEKISSESLEIEGRSLWQDARIRFMRNSVLWQMIVCLSHYHGAIGKSFTSMLAQHACWWYFGLVRNARRPKCWITGLVLTV